MVEAPAYLLIGAVVLFLGFMGVQAFWPQKTHAERRKAQKDHSTAVSEGSDEDRSATDRARALVRAARIALDQLHRPRLAARHAEWAHRLAPGLPEVVEVASIALVKARRVRALERLLWLSAEAELEGAERHARDALIALYEGPMKRPERARAIRLWTHAPAATSPSAGQVDDE
jgi:hypothetical protein